MAKKKLNERNTEDIVRQHFQKDKLFYTIVLEEQSSKNPRITKLLQNASKKGNGIGKPEFLISVNDEQNLLIVIECKADILKHESKKRDKFADYAVDGVLLYSSYLSKEFDVLSIAVSGVETDNIKVSYFIQRKNKDIVEQIFGNILITVEDIVSGLSQDVAKRNEKYERLLDYSKILNEQLHKLRIKEDKRSLLVSSALISLKNKDFYRIYSGLSSNKMLAEMLVNTVRAQLEDENLQGDKVNRLMENYSFIKSHPSFIDKNDNKDLKDLKELIDEIDNNINGYSRTYKYYDVLGQFYIEFLRYSNADKGLGIVLTPPHITEFFADIVDIQSNDVVFDSCTGTSGFLVSAMKKMIKKCNGDSDKEKNIKQNQLFGVEYQPEIYPLAVSNMLLHGDGKSNIIGGNCFDNSTIKEIQSKKPTVGFLNPPYKSKREDIEELGFILNNLECLEKHGRCVAIVPMSCALAQSGEKLRLKEQLLSKHTLKAVFSMPNELFKNSKVSVVTCIMVFEAHIPHPNNKKTFFGYFKDDGFFNKKTKGRFDYDNQWMEIKKKWIDLYTNNTVEVGFSEVTKVSANDEWCAEAYMETDYSRLTVNYLEQVIRDVVAFKITSNLNVVGIIGDCLIYNKDPKVDIINLNFNKHKNFSLDEIFTNIECTKGGTTNELTKGNEVPYIAAKKANNGLSGMCAKEDNNQYISKGNCIVFIHIGAGSAGYTTYQENDFIGMNGKTSCGYNENINKYNALFLVGILDQERPKYSFGRSWTGERLLKTKIKLPVDNQNNPDWQFMEDYIKSLPYSANL